MVATAHTDRFPVGEYIQDELDARGWSEFDLIERMDGDFDTNYFCVEFLLAAGASPDNEAFRKVRLDETTAGRLGKALGVSSETLLNLDRMFAIRDEKTI